MPLEIAVDSLPDAEAAIAFADRIELCRDLNAHGLTPDAKLVCDVRRAIDAGERRVELVALVRPVESLCLNEAQADTCELQIAESIDAGADSVAFGALSAAGEIDHEMCERLVRACRGNPAIFHRAFDFACDRAQAIESLVLLGFTRVLTAGLASFDHSRVPLAQRLRTIGDSVGTSRGRLSIVACGGVRSSNVHEFATITPELHSSCGIGGHFNAGEAHRIRAAISSLATKP